VFSTIHVRSIRRQAQLEAVAVARRAHDAGEPVAPEPKAVASAWPEVLGFFSLTIALLIGGVAGAATGGVLLFAVPIVWGALLYAAYRGAGDSGRIWHAIATVICALLVGAIEFGIWLGALS
jgi:hypothetical protein